jgi:hypothetical protein
LTTGDRGGRHALHEASFRALGGIVFRLAH